MCVFNENIFIREKERSENFIYFRLQFLKGICYNKRVVKK